jgi:hypothetical protein
MYLNTLLITYLNYAALSKLYLAKYFLSKVLL